MNFFLWNISCKKIAWKRNTHLTWFCVHCLQLMSVSTVRCPYSECHCLTHLRCFCEIDYKWAQSSNYRAGYLRVMCFSLNFAWVVLRDCALRHRYHLSVLNAQRAVLYKRLILDRELRVAVSYSPAPNSSWSILNADCHRHIDVFLDNADVWLCHRLELQWCHTIDHHSMNVHLMMRSKCLYDRDHYRWWTAFHLDDFLDFERQKSDCYCRFHSQNYCSIVVVKNFDRNDDVMNV